MPTYNVMGGDYTPKENPIVDKINRKTRKVRIPSHRSKTATHEEFLTEVVQKPRYTRSCPSSFFLSVSHIEEVGWECECGRNNMFKSEPCLKCGRVYGQG